MKLVLPDQGYKVVAHVAQPNTPPHQKFLTTHELAAQAALSLDQKGGAVYHACASFLTSNSRKQENAGWARSFWLDADVAPDTPGKYASQAEAATDLVRVCKALAFPIPLLVKSGGGLHAYWPFDEDVDIKTWTLAAIRLKAVLDHIGFKQDKTRTADSASVLRPVGTHWRKSGERLVDALNEVTPIPFEYLVSQLEQYEQVNDLEISAPPALFDFEGIGDDDLSIKREFPPSSAHKIVQFCPTLNHIASARGLVEEPLWRAMLGLVKATVEGEGLCHEWSAGHPEYDPTATQDKIDGWKLGPTTCAHFRGTNGNQCGGCERTCSSPIQLGYSEEAEPPEVEVPPTTTIEVAQNPQVLVPLTIPNWPKYGFRWDGVTLSRSFKDDDGLVTWVAFCDTLWYPTMRIRDEDGVWALLIQHQKLDRSWHQFTLPTQLIAEPQPLAAALAAREIFVHGKNGKSHAQEYLREYTNQLMTKSIQQLTYSKMGWHDEDRSFVVGNQRITPQGLDTIIPGEWISSAGWNQDFGRAGTAQEWVNLVDVIYNRPGAEAYQFVIAAAFAAPLVAITEADNWHGIPIAISGTTGLGKTTVCRAAVSIYGANEKLLVSSTEKGATLNALITKIGIARHLPLIVDELTDREPEDISALMYMLSNGKPKERLSSSGMMINTGLGWDTISFLTGNRCFTDLLQGLEKEAVSEAGMIRVFEIVLPADFNTKIWGDMNAVDLIENQLFKNYGHVGEGWLQYVMANKDAIRKDIEKLRSKYNPNVADETRERFFRDLIATVLVAMKHATQLGYLSFDIPAVAKWARENTMVLRSKRVEARVSPEDTIARFISSLHGRTIVTQRLGDRRTGKVEAILEEPRFAPVARICLEDRLVYVAIHAIREWCTKNHVAFKGMLEEMGKRGMLAPTSFGSTNSKDKLRLGTGTNMATSPCQVYRLDFDAVYGTMQRGDATGAEVLPFPTSVQNSNQSAAGEAPAAT
jgi:hypothetical protein